MDGVRHGREAPLVSFLMIELSVVRWGWSNTYNLAARSDRAKDLPTQRTSCGVGLLQPLRNAGLAELMPAFAWDSDGVFHWLCTNRTNLVLDRLQTSSQQVFLGGKGHVRELRGQENE
jgi:hypothetical protein